MGRSSGKYPIYLSIADAIRDGIVAGRLEDGAKLPSQRELAKSYDTTLMTVRQALELLEDEELIRTEHGRGMFVSAPRVGEFDRERIFGLGAELGSEPGEVATKLIDGSSPMAFPEAANALGYGEGETPRALRRLRFLGGAPIVLQASYLAPRLAGLADSFDPAASLYDSIAEYGKSPVAMTREILMPVGLDAEAAARLGKKPGEPAMLSARMSRSVDGEALLYDEATIAGGSFFVCAERVGGRHGFDFNFGGGKPRMADRLFGED